jgi:hypothetical protein
MIIPLFAALTTMTTAIEQPLSLQQRIEKITPPKSEDFGKLSNIGFYPNWRFKLYQEQIYIRREATRLEKIQAQDISELKKNRSILEATLKIPEVAKLQELMNDPIINELYANFKKDRALVLIHFNNIMDADTKYLSPDELNKMESGRPSGTTFDGPTKDLFYKFDQFYRPLWIKYSDQLISHAQQTSIAAEAARRVSPGIVTEVAIRAIQIKQLRILWEIADMHTRMLFVK